MNESIFQILLILAYLSIGLFSVVFPIFAISVNFLPQERWEGEKEHKKRIEELKTKIQTQTASLKGEKQDSSRATELREQIEKYENELEGTELRSKYLSAKGAVGIPILLLTIALAFSCGGIFYYYEGAQNQLAGAENYVAPCAFLSGVLIAFAAASLYKTVSAVEFASLRTEKTLDFEIGFGIERATSKTMKLGASDILSVCARTIESDVDRWTIVAKLPKALGLSVPETDEIVYMQISHLNMIQSRCFGNSYQKATQWDLTLC